MIFRRIYKKHLIYKFHSRSITNQPIIKDFHHIKLFSGSANATKDLFMNKFNFKLHSFSGPETGNKETLDYFLMNGNMRIIITTPLSNDTYIQRTMNNFLSKHGDGIGDVAEFVRYGTKWSRFERNFDKQLKHFFVIPHYVFHTLNSTDLTDTIKWIESKGITNNIIGYPF